MSRTPIPDPIPAMILTHIRIAVLQLERLERRTRNPRDTRVLVLARELMAAIETRIEQGANDGDR